MRQLFTDQMNRTIRLEGIPRRIVSLVPSQTELLFDLGLENEVLGITKFCIYPDAWFRSKTRVGGTKYIDIEKVKSLSPDLIIGNKEENTKQDIDALEKIAPVWMSDIHTVEDALSMIRSIGEICGTAEKSRSLAENIKLEFDLFRQNPLSGSFLYFIWKDPNYVAGTKTFISDLLESTGLRNLCRIERYPEWNASDEVPDYILLSSEPYPFKLEHIEEMRKRYPNSKISLIDGEMCSWYGSRMQLAPKYLSAFFEK
jgi:ABC-type Fe3+-hydroxamate transport system substrate-binding protein